MEKTTTIDLVFNDPRNTNYEATVTLTRKGKAEAVTFSMARKKSNTRGEDELRFHFVVDRHQLQELHQFIGVVLKDSAAELWPEDGDKS